MGKKNNDLNTKIKKTNSIDNLIILEGLSAVRTRPGMYIGTTDLRGLHHILWEIVDNSMDEAANGYADTIKVSLNADGSVTVRDNGRGIPTEIHPKYKISGIELVYTKLHAGGKFDNTEYKFSGGLHGVGSAVTNALSKWCTVEVFRNKKHYKQEFHSFPDVKGYQSGIPKGPIELIGPTKDCGTQVTFMPDDTVFNTTKFDRNIITRRLKELAYLNKGITLILDDFREKNEDGEYYHSEYCFNGGIIDFIEQLNIAKEKITDKVLYISGSSDNFELEFAVQYVDSPGDTIISYVNNIPTTEGGTHETGFKLGYTKCMNDYIKKNNLLKAKDPQLVGDDFREGMVCVLSIKMQNIQFEGQTKTKLGNPEVKFIVEGIIAERLSEYLDVNKNKTLANLISSIAINAAHIRIQEKKSKEAIRSKNSMTGKAMVGKLAACSGKNPEINELFIVEGDSAGGTAKQGRDKKFQAILPLRGKPKNTESVKKHEILSNEEFSSLIYALGTDFDNDFDIEKLNYHKIIILADADHDGEHIRSLLLTFFYRHMKQLIQDGHVYFGMPPLYKVTKGNNVQYAYNDEALEKLLEENKNAKLQRYKGLGEMSYTQLWDTTLNPKTRTLQRITIEDAAEADRMISLWMGNKADVRKEYINNNADFNKTDKFAEKLGG